MAGDFRIPVGGRTRRAERLPGPSPQPCRPAVRKSVGPCQYQANLFKKRRIPPCGRGLSSSSWCEVEIVQGVWTCLACNSIAPGNITVPSSW